MVTIILLPPCVSAKFPCSASPGGHHAPNYNGVHRPQDTAPTGESACYPGGEG